MKKRELFFLLIGAAFIIMQHLYYFSEVYYDRDLCFYTYNTLDVLKGHGWYYSPWHTKLAGINFIILAAFKLFGQSFKSIYLAALFFNLLSVFFIYYLAKLLLSKETKLYFLLPFFFSMIFTAEPVMSYTANTEIFLAAFEIAGILFLGLGRYFVSGLLLGSGFLIRQTAFLTFFSGALFLIVISLSGKKTFREFIKELLIFSLGFTLPLALISVYFLYKGVFDKVVNYAFIYNLRNFGDYLTDIRKKDLPLSWIHKFDLEIILLSILSLTGLIFTMIRKTKMRILISLWFSVVCLWLLKVGIQPHHFISLIAPLACISLFGISDILEKAETLIRRKSYLGKTYISVVITILLITAIFLFIPFISGTRQRYPPQFRQDRFYAAAYIKEHSKPQDKIFVWDNFSLGAIFLWSGRDSVTRFHEKYAFLPLELGEYMVPYVEGDSWRFNQKEFLLDLDKNKPKYIVLVQDYAKVIRWRNFAKKHAVSWEDRKALIRHPSEVEKEAFPEFFVLLDKGYKLEKEIGICQIYRVRE